MSDPLQVVYGPSTPQLTSSGSPSILNTVPPLLPSNNNPTQQPNAGGMISLLPAQAQPQQSPPHNYHHSRSQSTIVPMHSPNGSLLGAGFDLQALMNMNNQSRLHGQQLNSHTIGMAGILATPSATATTNLTSPTSQDYAYPVTADGYDVYAEIGSGAFSTVYRGVVRDIGEEVAIKVIDLDMFNTNWDEIRKEIMIMSQLNHPNVVKLKTAFVDGQDLWLVMSLATAGSAAACMKELHANNGLKDEIMIATILKEVLQALAYFHKHSNIHRDVKAGNILVDSQGNVQLADFGVAGTLMEGGDRKKNRQTFTGTPCWMAPEVMERDNDAGYDERADIWSLGITALELAYGRAPYAKFPPMKVMLLTLQEEPPTAEIYKDNSYEFSKHFHNMVAKCLRRDPKKRPTAKKLLEHKFFTRAADAKYIFEHLVQKLPQREQATEKIHVRSRNAQGPDGVASGATSNVNGGVDGGNVGGQAKQSSTMTKAAAHPGAGVKLGSWIFDEDEIESFKSTEGEKGLDLLTGTLTHQHSLPHHASAHAREGVDTVQEEDGDEYVTTGETSSLSPTLTTQQQQQPTPLHNLHSASSFSHSQQTHAQIPQQQQQQQEEPHDFFAGISAPAQDNAAFVASRAASTGRLSPSTAFAAASSGRLSPAAAFAAASNPSPSVNSTTNAAHRATSPQNILPPAQPTRVPSGSTPLSSTTPTLSSVQGKTRQFVVEDSEHPPTNLSQPQHHQSTSPSKQHPASQQQQPQQQSVVDLLADDFDLSRLSGSSAPLATPSASEQFLAATGQATPTLDASLATAEAFAATATGGAPPPSSNSDPLLGGVGSNSDAERTASPLNLDALALTPGSATLAYLAAMSTDSPSTTQPASATPVQLGKPPLPVSNTLKVGLSPSTRPVPSPNPLAPNSAVAGGSPIARPFNSKRASGPLSSLLPVMMPVLRQPATNTSPQATRLQPGAQSPNHSALPPSMFNDEAAPADSNLFSPAHVGEPTSHLHLDITSPLGSVQPVVDPDQPPTSESQRQVGRFQVTSTEKHH